MLQRLGTLELWVLVPASVLVAAAPVYAQTTTEERDPARQQDPAATTPDRRTPTPDQTSPASPPHRMGSGPGRRGMMMGPQGMMGRGGGWGARGPYQRLFDPNTVTTVQGRVVEVQTVPPIQGMSPGVHVLVRTDDGETLPVHLGPQWFLGNLDTQLEAGDQVRVAGSRVEHMGSSFFIASRVTKGDEVLELRDEQGFPAWSWRSQATRPSRPSRSQQQQQQQRQP